MIRHLKLILTLGIIAGIFITGCQAGKTRSNSSMKRVVAVKVGENTIKQEYEIILPDGYKHGMDNPVLLIFHDDGDSGEKVMKKWGKLVEDTNYILVCPTFPRDVQKASRQENERLMSIVQDLQERHNINIKNLYVIGYGEGARLGQLFSMNYPALVRGACVLFGDSYAPPNPLGNKVPFLIVTGPSVNGTQGEVLERRLAESGYQAQIIKQKEETDAYSPRVGKLCLEFFQKFPPLPKEEIKEINNPFTKTNPTEIKTIEKETILKVEPLPGDDENEKDNKSPTTRESTTDKTA